MWKNYITKLVKAPAIWRTEFNFQSALGIWTWEMTVFFFNYFFTMLAHSMMPAFVTSLFAAKSPFPWPYVISFGETQENLVKCLWSHDEMEVLLYCDVLPSGMNYEKRIKVGSIWFYPSVVDWTLRCWTAQRMQAWSGLWRNGFKWTKWWRIPAYVREKSVFILSF